MSLSLFRSNVHAVHRTVLYRHIARVLEIQVVWCIYNRLISFQLRIGNLIFVVFLFAIVSIHCMHSRSIVAVIDAASASATIRKNSASSIAGAENHEFKFTALSVCKRKLWQLTARAMFIQHVRRGSHALSTNEWCVRTMAVLERECKN